MTEQSENSIVLVNPPSTLRERYGRLSAGGSHLPPLGLCYLAAVTRENGYATRIVDAVALGLDYKEALLEVLRDAPRYIGLTASTITILNAARLAREIKNRDKDRVVMIGGSHITAVPEETMERFPQFDIGVVGEGEATIIDLMETYNRGNRLDNVKGIIFRENGKLKLTEPRAYIKDLDSLPMPAWDLLPYLPQYYRPAAQSVKRLPSTSIVTARGCIGKCTFCDRKVFGNRCRGHSTAYIMRMIKNLYYDYGIRDLQIDDDTFMIFKRRMIEVCEALIEEKMDLSWCCLARVDHVNPDLLQLMKKAGCWQIQYGIESGSQEILDVLRKGTNLQQIEQAIRWTREAGINSKGFFMIGNPLETEETMRQTIEFAKKLDLDDFQMTFLTPFPGSEFYEMAAEYGTFNYDWAKMNEYNVTFIPNGLTEEMLVKYHKKAFREFYLRPRIILSYLRRMRHLELILLLSRVALSFLRSFAFAGRKKLVTS